MDTIEQFTCRGQIIKFDAAMPLEYSKVENEWTVTVKDDKMLIGVGRTKSGAFHDLIDNFSFYYSQILDGESSEESKWLNLKLNKLPLGKGKLEDNVNCFTGKPWGHESLLFQGKYVVKLLHVNAGQSLSLQYHEHKTESMYVLAGQGFITVSNHRNDAQEEVIDLTPGKFFTLLPLTIHRITATLDLDILECSTPELTDIVRLADDYGRVPWSSDK